VTRKNLFRTALIALPLVAALLYIALNWYTIEEEKTWVQAGPEARRNPYLAYTRLLDRMEVRTQSARSASRLDSLPQGGSLVLAARRLAYMTPPRVRELVAWVNRGGRLVVEAEPFGIDDPLLDALGIERVFPDWMGKPAATPRRIPPADITNEVVAVSWPGEARQLKLSFPGFFVTGFRDLRVRSEVHAGKQGARVVALTFAQGEGRVTVLPRFNFLNNGQIGKLDHARLGWLMALPRDPGSVATLFLRMESPPFLDWVRQNAWAVAVAAALLVAAGLARIVPRFGPLAPDAPPVRRSLMEHIVATGRFLWARGEQAYLLEALRERVWRAAGRRGIRAPSPARRANAIEAVAKLASVPPAAAERALFAQAENAPAFTDAAARLQDIESGLALRARRNPVRRGFRK